MSKRSGIRVLVALLWALTGLAGCVDPNAPSEKDGPDARGVPDSQPTSQPTKPAEAKLRSVILEPSPGRPVIISPGDSFYCLVRVSPHLGKRAFIRLVHADIESLQYPLRHETPLAVTADRHGAVVLEIPQQTPDGLYDLLVQGERETIKARHCIRIVSEFKTRFRFVHLSDMDIGDPSAPKFDDRLADEINLLAPEFVVATGDYTNWAHVLDKSEDWHRILDFFARFDAPVYLVCGDRDHEEGFTTFVANSLVGSFSYGSYHGLLLFDHPRRPIDDEQLKWVVRELSEQKDATANLIVTHNDDLRFLDHLAKEVEDLPAFLADHRVRLILAGGHDDWDYQEYAARLKPFPGLHYVRTHQASTCLRGRATGVSHYRVIEVDGESMSYIYDPNEATTRQQSTPVGRLRTFFDQANDGTNTTVTVTVQNSLNQAFENCRLKLRVAKHPTKQDTEPVVAGGRLVRTLDAGSHWLCEVSIDLPDKGGLRVMATTQGRIPEPVALGVKIDGTTQITMQAKTTKEGLKYYLSEEPFSLLLTNAGEKIVKAWPVVRLDGNVLPIDKKKLDLWPVELAGGQNLTIPLRLQVASVAPGPHLLQVFFLEDPLKRVKTFPVTVKLGT